MSKKHIMIVDDEPDIVETTRIRLEGNGYEVSTSYGAKAVPDIKRVKPDLILLDIMMPEVDGLQVLRELKRDPDLASVPVIVFSAKQKETMMEPFGPEGIFGYISKPYNAEELLGLIRRALGE